MFPVCLSDKTTVTSRVGLSGKDPFIQGFKPPGVTYVGYLYPVSFLTMKVVRFGSSPRFGLGEHRKREGFIGIIFKISDKTAVS